MHDLITEDDMISLPIGSRISTDDGNATITGQDEFECFVATFDATGAEPYGQEVIIEPHMLGQVRVISTPLQIEAHAYYNDEGQQIGHAIELPGRTIMVYGHDYNAQPLTEGYLDLQLDEYADDFASAEHMIRAHHADNMAAAHCDACGENLELIDRETGWVCVRSGDEGGTYDYCPETSNHKHDVVKH